jgi:uncharacterized protein (UPF0212 family)
MTSPIEFRDVQCPGCGETYETQFRASMNLGLDNFSDDYVEEMSTGTCPNCRTKVDLGALVVREDGTWEMS